MQTQQTHAKTQLGIVGVLLAGRPGELDEVLLCRTICCLDSVRVGRAWIEVEGKSYSCPCVHPEVG
jgi:hypothetical protein